MRRRFAIKRLLLSFVVLAVVIGQCFSTSIFALKITIIREPSNSLTEELQELDKQDTVQYNYQTTSETSLDLFDTNLTQAALWADKSNGEALIAINHDVLLGENLKVLLSESRAMYFATVCEGHDLTTEVVAENLYQMLQLYEWVDFYYVSYSANSEQNFIYLSFSLKQSDFTYGDEITDETNINNIKTILDDFNSDTYVPKNEYNYDTSSATVISLTYDSTLISAANNYYDSVNYIHPIGSTESNESDAAYVTAEGNENQFTALLQNHGSHHGQLYLPYILQEYYELIESQNIYFELTVQAIYTAFDGFVAANGFATGNGDYGNSTFGENNDKYAELVDDTIDDVLGLDLTSDDFSILDASENLDALYLLQYYSENGRYFYMSTDVFDDYDISIQNTGKANLMYYMIFLMNPSYAIENESDILSELYGSIDAGTTNYVPANYGALDYTYNLEDLGLTEIESDNLTIVLTTTIDSDFDFSEEDISVYAYDDEGEEYSTAVTKDGNTITVTVSLIADVPNATVEDYIGLTIYTEIEIEAVLSGTINFVEDGDTFKDVSDGVFESIYRNVTYALENTSYSIGEYSTVPSAELYRYVYYLTYDANNADSTSGNSSDTYSDSDTYYDSGDVESDIPLTTDDLNTLFGEVIDTNDDGVVFIGWTESANSYSKENPVTNESDYNNYVKDYLLSSVEFTDGDRTIYAVWAADEDNNGIPDFLEVVVVDTSTNGTTGTTSAILSWCFLALLISLVSTGTILNKRLNKKH